MHALAATRAPLRSLIALAFAAILALSLVATTSGALAATPRAGDRVTQDGPPSFEAFRGRGLLRGITWE